MMKSPQTVVTDDCPDGFSHGPADGAGRCPWCERKIDHARPRTPEYEDVSELTLAYEQAYDPDFGALSVDQLLLRHRTGRQP